LTLCESCDTSSWKAFSWSAVQFHKNVSVHACVATLGLGLGLGLGLANPNPNQEGVGARLRRHVGPAA